ncbi:MAG: hypothetical protein KAT09_00380 [Candidatus Aegiribacteria sp.]|nr:hypothetical protein [Candidatus Aegiribacteria sp.]
MGNISSTIVFDSNYEYLDQTSWPSTAPFLVSAVDSGGFIGLQYTFRDGEYGTVGIRTLGLWDDPRPPPEPVEMVCEPCAEYVPWQDDVPEIEVG